MDARLIRPLTEASYLTAGNAGRLRVAELGVGAAAIEEALCLTCRCASWPSCAMSSRLMGERKACCHACWRTLVPKALTEFIRSAAGRKITSSCLA
jgi:hypothetical protein